jgi:hypothetical protein
MKHKTWESREIITAQLLNENISDNFKELAERVERLEAERAALLAEKQNATTAAEVVVGGAVVAAGVAASEKPMTRRALFHFFRKTTKP